EWFGDLAAIDRRPRSADVVATSSSLVAVLPAPKFLALLAAHPTIANTLIAHLVMNIRELSDRLFDLSTLGVQNRVDAELLRLAQHTGRNSAALRVREHAGPSGVVIRGVEQVQAILHGGRRGQHFAAVGSEQRVAGHERENETTVPDRHAIGVRAVGLDERAR